MGFRNRLNFPPGSITAAMLADGSVTGPKLSFDAIDGKTITGAFIRTAATGKRWELDSVNHANQLRGYSGETNETAPGLVEIDSFSDFASALVSAPDLAAVQGPFLYLTADNTTAPDGAAYTYLHSDYLYLEGRKDSTAGVLIDCSAPGVTFDTTALGVGRSINFSAGTGKITVDGRISLINDPNWHTVGAVGEPAFAGNWAVETIPVSFSIDAVGCVRLRGRAKETVASSTTIFTLPVGYRPNQSMSWAVKCNNDASSVAWLSVNTAGAVTVIGNTAGARVQTVLDAVSFLAW